MNPKTLPTRSIPNRPDVPGIGPASFAGNRGAAEAAHVVGSVVRGLVDNPSRVRTEKRLTPHTVKIIVHVAAPDMPLVIGRRGRTACALRALLVRFRNQDSRKYRLTFCAQQSGAY